MRKSFIVGFFLILILLNSFAFTFNFEAGYKVLSTDATFKNNRDDYQKGDLIPEGTKLYSLERRADQESPMQMPEQELRIPVNGTKLGLPAGQYYFVLDSVEPTTYGWGKPGNIRQDPLERYNSGPKAAIILVNENGEVLCNKNKGRDGHYAFKAQYGYNGSTDQITCNDNQLAYRITSLRVPEYKRTELLVGGVHQRWYLLLDPEHGTKSAMAEDYSKDVEVEFCVMTKIGGTLTNEWSDCLLSLTDIGLDEFLFNEVRFTSVIDRTPFTAPFDGGPYTNKRLLAPLGKPEPGYEDEPCVSTVNRQTVTPPYEYFVLQGVGAYCPMNAREALHRRLVYSLLIHENNKEVKQNLSLQYGRIKYLIEPEFNTQLQPVGRPIAGDPYQMRFKVSRLSTNGRMEQCYYSDTYALTPSEGKGKVIGGQAMMNACGFNFEARSAPSLLRDYVDIFNIQFSREESKRFVLEYLTQNLGPRLNEATELLEREGIDDTQQDPVSTQPTAECEEGQTRQCGPSTNLGACEYGTQNCVNGEWLACSGAVYPASEIAGNNLDDDCDGETDEGMQTDPRDEDADEDGQSIGEGDCNDENPKVFKGARENCSDGVNTDCDEFESDEDDPDCIEVQGEEQLYDYFFFFGEDDFETVKNIILPRWVCADEESNSGEAAAKINALSASEQRILVYRSWFGSYFTMKNHETGEEYSCSTDQYPEIDGRINQWTILCENLPLDSLFEWVIKYPSSCNLSSQIKEAAPIGVRLDADGKHSREDLG